MKFKSFRQFIQGLGPDSEHAHALAVIASTHQKALAGAIVVGQAHTGAPYRRRTEIEVLLKDQLDKAREEYTAACSRFDSLSEEIYSGPTSSDVANRVEEAGTERKQALINYMGALKGFSDFTLMGIVPEDEVPPS